MIYRARLETTTFLEVEADNTNEARKLIKQGYGTIVKGNKVEIFCQEKTGHAGWHDKERDKKYNKDDISRLREIYAAMYRRCYNMHHEHWDLYGKQRVGICKEWLDNFYSFVDWSLSNGYKSDLTLDKLDNMKDYSPSNCRWATWKEQANNRKDTRYHNYKGEILTTRQIADLTGIPRRILIGRVLMGKTIEEAVNMGWKEKE